MLAPLSAPHGVFAVLGNHDDDRDMPAALATRGIEVLRDARTRLTMRGETLDILGIRYWTRRLSDLTRLARGAAPATMFVAHTPARLTEAAQLGLPMMLSGHTHGGQVVLPGLGAVAARQFPIIAGHGSLENTSAFVSRGVGTVYVPVRSGCPPEVAILTLKRPGVNVYRSSDLAIVEADAEHEAPALERPAAVEQRAAPLRGRGGAPR